MLNRSRLLKTVKFFVDSNFSKENLLHLDKTLFWLLKLKPDADEALQIAAYSHDIERAFNKSNGSKKTFVSGKSLEKHQSKGASIMYDFLINNSAKKSLARRVKTLIEKHEIGGTPDQNVLKDADSISYLQNNALRHVYWVNTRGFKKQEIRRKFDWMYRRISSKKAKTFAKPFYEKAISKLEVI